jgi:hypothetical protein
VLWKLLGLLLWCDALAEGTSRLLR